MNEDEYKDVYQRVIGTKCVYEKTILLQFAQCDHAEKRLLAEREAVNCSSEACQFRCQKFLDVTRQNARFALGQTQADEQLPHSKEVKVQAGGLFGLQQLLENSDPINIEPLDDYNQRFNEQQKAIVNINGCLEKAEQHYLNLDKFPYADIVKAILRFEVRKKRQRNKRDSTSRLRSS